MAERVADVTQLQDQLRKAAIEEAQLKAERNSLADELAATKRALSQALLSSSSQSDRITEVNEDPDHDPIRFDPNAARGHNHEGHVAVVVVGSSSAPVRP